MNILACIRLLKFNKGNNNVWHLTVFTLEAQER